MTKSLDIAKSVIQTEIDSIVKLLNSLDDSFDIAINEIHQACKKKAKVVISGMGKSGLIAQKISASLSSTGTPSIYIHPADACHGDLGIIQPEDIVILLSYSGESNEVLQLIPFLKQNNNFIIAVSGNPSSTLCKVSNCSLLTEITKEACLYDLAPTSSSTNMLVLGDALVVALMDKNQFTPTDFARFHPAGSLGKRLLTSVKDVMQTDLPLVFAKDNMLKVIDEMSRARLGLVLIIDEKSQLKGIITDGDLRRAIQQHKENWINLSVLDIASKNPAAILPDTRLEDAKNLMNQKKITSLVVKEDLEIQSAKILGVIQIYQCEI